MQIVIVSKPGAALEAYRRFFEAQGIDPIHQPSIADLFQKLPDRAISGVVLDIQSVLKADEGEKNQLHIMEEIFPNVRTNWSPGSGFRALYSNCSKSGEDNLTAFLADCRKFKPRALRKDKRCEKNFNILFWPMDSLLQHAQRAFTLNISYGGLFVCTCYAPSESSFVWIKLGEVDEAPFKVLVKWTLAWGIGMRIPGFGGSFVEMEASLAERLESALNKDKRVWIPAC